MESRKLRIGNGEWVDLMRFLAFHPLASISSFKLPNPKLKTQNSKLLPIPYSLFPYRIVTNSSAEVGCNAMVLSRSRLVAPMVMATARLWIISAASLPTINAPKTLSVSL